MCSSDLDHYDNKTGQEGLFLHSIEDDVSGKIEWRGEDGERWTTMFFGDYVIDGEGTTIADLLV